jgi:hypothetical protein
MTLSAVHINGNPVQCADLNAVVIHGRSRVTDGPTASSATVTIYDPLLPNWVAGDTLEVFCDSPPEVRFTGTITDVSLVGHGHLGGIFEVDAAGRVADLGVRDIGDVPWPVEYAVDRANRILTGAGLPFAVEGAPTIQVNARDVDRKDALGLITSLAQDTGAAVFDQPDGTIVFQHYSARVQDKTKPLPMEVDGCVVLWEPSWEMTAGDVINSVTIPFGPEVQGGTRPTVTVTNPASVTKFQRRHATVSGDLADELSARERGSMIIDLHSLPHWAMDGVVVLLDKVQSALPFLNLRCGSLVKIVGMPQPAPEVDPVRIVEGWTHAMGVNRDVLTLRLSHPSHSYAAIPWEVVPIDVRWMDVAPTVQFRDVILLSDLELVAP